MDTECLIPRRVSSRYRSLVSQGKTSICRFDFRPKIADPIYDQLIFEQPAGDQCEEDAATEFLMAGHDDRVVNQYPKSKALQQQDELDKTVKTTSATFLRTDRQTLVKKDSLNRKPTTSYGEGQ